MADWGGLPFLPYDTPCEVAIADAMGKMGTKLNTSFQLALGDNFYFDGVQSVSDHRFQVRDYFKETVISCISLFLANIRTCIFSNIITNTMVCCCW